MVKEKAQSVEELEHNGVSVIRTIAVREKSYWNEGVCFRSAWDAAEFAKPLFENADNRLDEKRLKEEQPEIYAKYKKSVLSRRFTVKAA